MSRGEGVVLIAAVADIEGAGEESGGDGQWAQQSHRDGDGQEPGHQRSKVNGARDGGEAVEQEEGCGQVLGVEEAAGAGLGCGWGVWIVNSLVEEPIDRDGKLPAAS